MAKKPRPTRRQIREARERLARQRAQEQVEQAGAIPHHPPAGHTEQPPTRPSRPPASSHRIPRSNNAGHAPTQATPPAPLSAEALAASRAKLTPQVTPQTTPEPPRHQPANAQTQPQARQVQPQSHDTPPVQRQPVAPAVKRDRSHMTAPPVEPAPKKRRRFDFIAFIGELLVTVGVLLGLFAFWQVYITDLQVESDKVTALKNFNEAVECVQQVSDDIRTDDPPVMDKPAVDQTWGAMHVPSWHYMVLPIKEGTTAQQLDVAAAGHYEETAMPGDKGNFSVAAHRRSRGSSFRHIDDLRPGDKVVVETKDAWYVYRMYDHEIVLPSQSDVILPVPGKPEAKPEKRLMTMTSCHPEYGNSERYIVHLELEYWTPRTSGVPKELAEGGYTCM